MHEAVSWSLVGCQRLTASLSGLHPGSSELLKCYTMAIRLAEADQLFANSNQRANSALRGKRKSFVNAKTLLAVLLISSKEPTQQIQFCLIFGHYSSVTRWRFPHVTVHAWP